MIGPISPGACPAWRVQVKLGHDIMLKGHRYWLEAIAIIHAQRLFEGGGFGLPLGWSTNNVCRKSGLQGGSLCHQLLQKSFAALYDKLQKHVPRLSILTEADA